MPDAETATVTYTAPASQPVTVVHILNPDVKPGEKPEPHDGETQCGLQRLVADLWPPITLRADDAICRACRGISDEQATLC